MDDLPILGRDDDRDLFQRFQAHYGVPAYVRRARQVEDAFEHLIEQCRRQREKWLSMVRIRLGRLHALAGDWRVLRPWLRDDDQLHRFQELHEALIPQLRLPLEPTSSAHALRRALKELLESIEHFNQRWQAFLQTVEVAEVNKVREGYNRYYVLEKECAVRSARLARQGFRQLEPLTPDDLVAVLPPLPLPQGKA
jgi:hypothetical protein